MSLPHTPSSTIPFHVIPVIGTEIETIKDAFSRGKLCGDGYYSKQCEAWFKNRYHFPHSLLTTSCTDALEMAGILADLKPNDEIIAPSYTFVSSVNAFALRGAKIVFADSCSNHPNIDLDSVESLITERTRAIVVVHYAGMACDMERAQALCKKHNLFLIEDAAQALDSYYKDKPLGTFGDYAAFSFHDTKNVIAGEGGLIVTNRESDRIRAEIIRQKGTNRSLFLRGEVDKYGWVDIGSSFLPSELNAAVLWAQLQAIDTTQTRRLAIWERYYNALSPLQDAGLLALPQVPSHTRHNAHIFYIVAPNAEIHLQWCETLKAQGIHTMGHYPCLHNSPYFEDKHDGRLMPHAQYFAEGLLRLPLYWGLENSQIDRIIEAVFSLVK